MSDTEKDKGAGRRQGHDAYDWFVLAVAVLALLAAGAAAWFTWEQAAVARDQMQRSLRAYVVIEAELAAERGTGRPYVKFNAENMGQTPVYRLHYVVMTTLRQSSYDDLPFRETMLANCDAASPRWERTGGATFGKTSAYGMGFSDSLKPGGSVASLFAGGRSAVAYGTACYRDIFGRAHAVRMCLEWHSEDQKPRECTDADELDTRP